MSYFYVCTSAGFTGTCATTAGALSKQSGAFGSGSLTAANVYPCIADAIGLGGAGAGDYVCVSDDHSYATASTYVLNGPEAAGDLLFVITVDHANCDVETTATAVQERHSSSLSFNYGGRLSFRGLWLESSNDFRTNSSDNSQVFFKNCTIKTTGANDKWVYTSKDGLYYEFTNCLIEGPASATSTVGYGANLRFINCTFSGMTNLWTTNMTGNGGCTIDLFGCDLTDVTGSLWYENSGLTGDDIAFINYYNCKLNATTPTFNTEGFASFGRINVSLCAGSAAAAEYQYSLKAMGGTFRTKLVFIVTGHQNFRGAHR